MRCYRCHIAARPRCYGPQHPNDTPEFEYEAGREFGVLISVHRFLSTSREETMTRRVFLVTTAAAAAAATMKPASAATVTPFGQTGAPTLQTGPLPLG